MNNAAPPIKPPRGIKATKETSGLLISVIRALSASETNEQREVEKAKLEKEYKRSDQRLDELVSLHDQDLANVMQIFSVLSEKVTATRERIHTVKENLNACKQLLRCKREELMKLWLEGVEHKHVLQLLNDVETLREIPLRLTQYIDKKLYLHATQLLVSALSMGDGNLQKVEGLREVRSEIHLKKHNLQTKLLQELSKYLYIDSTRESSLKRQGSNRDFQRGNELRSSRQNKGKRNLTDSASVPRAAIDVSTNNVVDIIEDEDSGNVEVNSEQFLAIIIECLALLNKIPETIEAIKAQMQNELLLIITNTTKEMKKFGEEGSGSGSMPISVVIDTVQFKTVRRTEGQTLLLMLLQHIFRQFRSIVVAHQVALRNFAHAVKKYSINVRLYEMLDVWSKIQAVLQLLLTEYLDIHNIVDGVLRTSSNLNDSAKDVNAFFTKKKLQKQKNSPLFRFDSSSHPMTLNNYFKDHTYNSLMTESGQIVKEKALVCEPDPRNIIFIFRPMMDFIEEIEKLIGCTSRNPCTLNSFITDYVKEVYLGMHHMLVATTIDSVIKNPDAWRALTTAEIMKEFNLSRPLLHSTVMVQKCVAELRLLMIALPLQGEHFCTLILNILHNYRETCQTAYRSIVQAEERNEERRIRSAMWLKDDDISRFIKSLPNWASLKHKSAHAYSEGHNRRLPVRQETQDEESPEDVRQRNLKEAEILASNLGEGGISANEILSDINQLKCLALLQESMEWFAFSQRSFLDELYQANGPENHVPLPAMPDALVKSLNQVNHEFEELSDTCILLLHLEVRVQCFHYLLPQGEYSNLCGGLCDTQEADSRVEELSRVLQHIDESLQAILDARKTKYIFEGLGHLVAKILITSAQYIRKIDENGIQKMCRNIFTLQQTLTNITMTRELALDYARQYFELFYETPDEILNNVLENGSKFSEIEYINAFQLISRSRAEYSSISKHLEKLSEILGDVGVIV